MKILLLATDDRSLGQLANGLDRQGYWVRLLPLDVRITSAGQLHGLFDGCPPDVIVADLSRAADCLPLRHVSKLVSDAWSGSEPSPTKLALFDRGHVALPDWPAYADDFILPPWDVGEVCARIKLHAYKRKHVQTDYSIKLADIVLDLNQNRATTASGETLRLTPREFELLRFLSQHRGKFFSREKLLVLVWGVHYDGGERTVDIHIRRLRSKLPETTAKLVLTRPGGYGMAAQ